MGTAEARPFSSHKPHVVEHGDLSVPSPPGLSQANAFERPFLRAESQDTMDHLRRHSNPNAKRQSIIDPASIRLSFIGSVSEFPHAMPLEEGLQKLYKLYEEYVAASMLLELALMFTETSKRRQVFLTLYKLQIFHSPPSQTLSKPVSRITKMLCKTAR